MNESDLRKAGLKVTSPRMRVLDVLQSSSERHLSAESIYRTLALSGDELNLASIYRVLTQFEQAGLVARRSFEGATSLFELVDGMPHDHMVCVETGKVIEFQDERIDALKREIADRLGYVIEEDSLVLYVRPTKRR